MYTISPNVKQIKKLLISGKFKKKLFLGNSQMINNRTFIFNLSIKNFKKNSKKNFKKNTIHFIYTENHCLLAIPIIIKGNVDNLCLIDSLGMFNTDLKIIKSDLESKLNKKIHFKKMYNYQPVLSDMCWGYVILFLYLYIIEKKSLVKVLYELHNINPFNVYNKVLKICF